MKQVHRLIEKTQSFAQELTLQQIATLLAAPYIIVACHARHPSGDGKLVPVTYAVEDTRLRFQFSRVHRLNMCLTLVTEMVILLSSTESTSNEYSTMPSCAGSAWLTTSLMTASWRINANCQTRENDRQCSIWVCRAVLRLCHCILRIFGGRQPN